ncbi:helix-turn-helix transcriptional regulator [bacterium]|nr:helix-turn-helix transcriptional regulator [bacterium]
MIYDDKKFIGSVIKNARKQAKLTQEELSEKVDMTDKNLGNIENGRQFPQVNNFLRLISELNISLEDFGVDIHRKNNPKRETILNKIFSANEEELELYNILLSSADKIKTIYKK